MARNDGLLVYDYNNDGQITEAKEFVFTSWGGNPDVATDIQALAAYFDSNQDGALDSQDSAWDAFGVWQDLNTDGVQQDGEFSNLANWGIESIALSYDVDSQAYAAAEGGVQVYGQMTVTYEDGTTGLAEDMALAVQPVETTTADAVAPTYPLDELVASYLDTMTAFGDANGDGELNVGELAYGLDHHISSFIELNSLSPVEHAATQQDVFNTLTDDLADIDPAIAGEIALDSTGDANGVDVLAALDHHFLEAYDAQLVPNDGYDASYAFG